MIELKFSMLAIFIELVLSVHGHRYLLNLLNFRLHAI